MALYPDEDVPQGDRCILERLSVGFLIFLFGAYALAVCGAFTLFAIALLFVFVCVGTIALLWKFRPSREYALVGWLVFAFVFLLSFPSAPSVFSGRDQGSYAGAAIRLAEDHTLLSYTPPVALEFFRRYGEGKALNVPGFYYTQTGALTTQFPLGYIAWLAAFDRLFGIAGLSLANAATLFLSLVTFFLLLRRFLALPFALGGVAVLAFSFPILWIFNNTLSENLALTLFLLSVFHFTSFLNAPNRFSWWLTISSALFLFLTRIEGIIVIGMIGIVTLFHANVRTYLREHLFSSLISAFVFAGVGIGMSVFVSLPFYRSVAKAILSSSPLEGVSGSSGIPILSPFLHMMEIFWTYGMISAFAMAILGGVVIIMKQNILFLTPLFLTLPLLLYLVHPFISADHPWLLRRLTFSLWPTIVFLAACAIAHLQSVFSARYPQKILFRPALFSLFFSALLVLPALPAVVPRLFFSENQELLGDIETLSNRFSDSDIVLVDRMASGDPFGMIADPMSTLFGKNAIYFFNPSDLNTLDISRASALYLVVRDGDEARYHEELGARFTLEEAFPYSLRTDSFTRETDSLQLPRRQKSVVSGTIFLIIPRSQS